MPCFGLLVDGYSMGKHGSVLGMSMWNFCRENWHWDFFVHVLFFSLSLSFQKCCILIYLQGGSNMAGTDLCVNNLTAQQLCDLERVKPQPPPSLLLGLEPVQSCLGVARVMSEQTVPRSVEQRRRHSSPYCCWSLW